MVKGRHNEEVEVHQVSGEGATPASTSLETERERVLLASQATGTPVEAAGSAVSLMAGEEHRLQLLAERAQVQVVREGVGQVQLRKVVRERQEMVPVTLKTEVLEITVRPVTVQAASQTTAGGTVSEGVGQLLIDGQPLGIGQSYEIPLTEERVQVLTQVYPVNEVVVRKQAHTVTHDETVTLRYEELEVQDQQGLARLVTDETQR